MKLDWYKNSYRRNLVDMHIEDWSDEFLSRFDPEEYLANLKRARIQSAMIYLQNHNGHCYFPTKVGHVHKAFATGENRIKRFIDRCHEEKIDVIGYYSLIYNTYEEERHPEWKLVQADGTSSHDRGGRYGLLCPNNPEYREFTKVQIKELLDYFDVDGMFYDMLFYPNVCHCDYCKRRLKEETGIDGIPATDWSDPNFRIFNHQRCIWMGEFAAFATNYTKELRPGMTVEHNYASSVASSTESCSTELVNDACDYTGGDLYGSLYNHTFAAKYYRGVTRNQPYEYMTCRCDNNLTHHTVTKGEGHLGTEIMLNVANHAATLVIDAIDPRGTMDKRVYDRIGRIFEREMAYEPYMNGTPLSDVGVLYFTEGKYRIPGQDYDNKSATVAACTALAEGNVLFDVLAGNRADLSGFKYILAPAIAGADEALVERLVNFVNEGGSLYFSGGECPELVKRFFGCDCLGLSEYTRSYIAPKAGYKRIFGDFNADYPLPLQYRIPLISKASPEYTVAYVTYPYTLPTERKFASIHSNPPGVATRIPAVLDRAYGRGRVIFSAAPIESDDRNAFKTIFLNIVKELLPMKNRLLTSSAPKQVELLAYERDGRLQLNAVNLLAGEERLPVVPFRVNVKLDKKPTALKRVPDGKDIAFSYKDGVLSFTVRGLRDFYMFETE